MNWSCRYAAPLYVDMVKTVITREQPGEEGGEVEEDREDEVYQKIFLGEVPHRPTSLATPCYVLITTPPHYAWR